MVSSQSESIASAHDKKLCLVYTFYEDCTSWNGVVERRKSKYCYKECSQSLFYQLRLPIRPSTILLKRRF